MTDTNIPDPARNSARTVWAALGSIAVAAGLAYANSLDAPFLFDDYPAIVRNQTIRHLGDIASVLSPPLDGAGVTGRPLVNLSLAINYALGGLDVHGYHLGSVLLHLLGSLALFGLLRRTFLLPALRGAGGGPASATGRAWGIALLWSVHPLLTESVVCVVQRNEVLVGLFYFLTFYAFVRAAESATTRTARGWQAVSVGSCLLGMACKEVMATAPLLVLLYDRTFVAGSFATAWRQHRRYYAALAATWLLLAFLMVRTEQRAGIVGFGLGMSSWDYLVTQCRAIALYLKLSFWPHPLVVDYGPVVFDLGDVWREALLVTGLGLTTLWALWRRPAWGFLGAWFFVILGPSSSIVPLTTQTIAEHRMYLPLAAVLTAVVLAIETAAGRRLAWVCAALALAAGWLTVQRNAAYRDELGFWLDTVAQQPANARVRASLGYYYMRHQRWDEAIAAYRRATELRPNFADAYSDLGTLLLEVGRVDEALVQHRRAVAIKPADAAIRFNLGVALERAGDRPGAVSAWEEALRLRPSLGAAHCRLGTAALEAGLPGKAIAQFEQALQSDPADAQAMAGWGQALTATGELPEAARRLQAAVALRPDVAEIHYNLGNVWLELGPLESAITSYQTAVRLKPQFVQARHNLALALMRAGRAAEALPHFEQVVQAMPGASQIRLNYAFALERAGRISEALAQAREAVSLDPAGQTARDYVQRLQARQPR